MRIVSIIIPAYNEEATILELLTRVNAATIEGITFEIIVVDDHSSDNTYDILQQHPEYYTTLCHHEVNQGKGAAVCTALKKATGDYILFQDADLEYDPADYSELLMPIQKLNADIVMGTRMSGAKCSRVHYFWHKVGNKFLTLFFNIINNTTFSDIYSCYFMYRRSLIDVNQLKTKGWEQQAEILTKTVKKAKCIYEVPINYYGRSYDEGKKIRWHHMIPVLWAIVRFKFLTQEKKHDRRNNPSESNS
ncbi:MAG: glycosyltransferase [Coxiella sp. (in: Bacteria)]|nr:MAG: glycosyltransferase [Coxiella sp. (in: g-proteobacteria)]